VTTEYSSAPEVTALLRGLPVFTDPLPAFDPDAAPSAPGPLFADWLREAIAAGVPQPQVMLLATADAQARPDARVLMLRGVDTGRGAWFFGASAGSPKGRQLAADPWASLVFYWPVQARQIRIRGCAAPAVVPEAAERRPASRLLERVGRQSEPMARLQDWDEEWARVSEEAEQNPGAAETDWTLYALKADQVEFWQGSTSRGHIRLRYDRDRDDAVGWTRTLLWP
jgi:pyridoxamine 5'-phosphate oxidase